MMLHNSETGNGGKGVSTFPLESLKKDWMKPANIVSEIRLLLFWVPAVMLLVAPFDIALRWWAVGAFLLIALTDSLDGYLARSRNEITDWGKFIDPLVDKMLVSATFLAIVIVYPSPVLIAVFAVILLREIVVTWQVRARGKLVAAVWSGKLKMLSQVFMALVWLAPFEGLWNVLRAVVTGIALFMTLYSWWRYWLLFVKSTPKP